MNEKNYVVTFQEIRKVSKEFVGKTREEAEKKGRDWIARNQSQAPWKAQNVLIKNIKIRGIDTFELKK